jgi:hypothetical protein
VSGFELWDVGQVIVVSFGWLPFTPPPPLVAFFGPSRR